MQVISGTKPFVSDHLPNVTPTVKSPAPAPASMKNYAFDDRRVPPLHTLNWVRTEGRALCVIFMILVSRENVKKFVLCSCTITSKTKINGF